MQLLAMLVFAQPGAATVEPQPLPEGVADSGINVLLDQSHAMSFFWHWSVQESLRAAGHRVSCSQTSLHRALTPGQLANARDQREHRFGLHRPMVEIAVPAYDVAVLVGVGSPLPYLDAEIEALKAFLERGGGVVVVGRYVTGESPLEEVLDGFGARFEPDVATVARGDAVPGLGDETQPRHVARVSGEWTVLLGNGPAEAVVATRAYGEGRIVVVADEGLCTTKDATGYGPNSPFLSWCVKAAAGSRPRRADDERRVPWEHEGIGGVYYPEHALHMGGLTVYYADNQLEALRTAADGGFPDVRDALAGMLPTPPNPGDDLYIILAGGDGGGWAENVFTPKVAGTIATDLTAVKSILAHELAHTMYGPEAYDGSPGCSLPDWWSEAHAGFFQRKVMWKFGHGAEFGDLLAGIMQWDPLFTAVDLANLREGEVGMAWTKVWFIWRLLDLRYGEQWYPNWLAHLHRKYAGDPTHRLTMDEYVVSVSEALGEDVAPLFERFGTTVGERASLPPIGPRR
jgi:hypothetical protein